MLKMLRKTVGLMYCDHTTKTMVMETSANETAFWTMMTVCVETFVR
jgi:hypothetical protein